MDNKEYAKLLLTLEKDIIKNYATAITEASYIELEKNIALMIQKSVKLHRSLSDLMANNNWYTVDKVEEKKINTTLSKLENEMDTIDE